jgi:hypothetical protein
MTNLRDLSHRRRLSGFLYLKSHTVQLGEKIIESFKMRGRVSWIFREAVVEELDGTCVEIWMDQFVQRLQKIIKRHLYHFSDHMKKVADEVI